MARRTPDDGRPVASAMPPGARLPLSDMNRSREAGMTRARQIRLSSTIPTRLTMRARSARIRPPPIARRRAPHADERDQVIRHGQSVADEQRGDRSIPGEQDQEQQRGDQVEREADPDGVGPERLAKRQIAGPKSAQPGHACFPRGSAHAPRPAIARQRLGRTRQRARSMWYACSRRNATQNRAMARSTLARKRARVASVETFMR